MRCINHPTAPQHQNEERAIDSSLSIVYLRKASEKYTKEVASVGQHDHPEDQDLILSSNIKRQMTAAVADNPSLTVREAFDDVAHQIPPAERDNIIPTYDSVRSSLDRTRRRYMPKIPASINDVDIRGRWRVTLDGNRFLNKLDNGWGIVVFFLARNKHSAVWVNVTTSILMLHLNQHQVLTRNF
ncbi:unnamed protein product [Mytilus coruscus]|uniref:Uncharacterized protein n=1 Tax=Mytilus coruscus TaxID=42192 RepID=A0A6J8DXQ0_MYTCO|nr:unnamed protein product [Mytilus coruscus]